MTSKSCSASFTSRTSRPILSLIAAATGAEEQADAALGKILDQFLQNRQRGIIRIDAKKDLVFGIVLTAETGIVLVGIRIQSFDGFQATYRGREVKIRRGLLPAEKVPRRAVQSQQVIDAGNSTTSGLCRWECQPVCSPIMGLNCFTETNRGKPISWAPTLASKKNRNGITSVPSR